MLTRIKDKLIILGLNETWAEAPFSDDSFEIWGLNALWKEFGRLEMGRADRWFEIHTVETRSEEHIGWMQKTDIPIIMQDAYPKILSSLKYPLEEVIAAFGRRYFLCSFSYEIALAMLMGYKEIHFYGCNMILNDDLIQRWSFEYWLGRAEQSGIKIVLQNSCDLLKSPLLYGYEADNTLAVYISRYMGELRKSVEQNLKAATINIVDALVNLSILNKERVKFMEEIFRRHGLEPVIGEGDDC